MSAAQQREQKVSTNSAVIFSIVKHHESVVKRAVESWRNMGADIWVFNESPDPNVQKLLEEYNINVMTPPPGKVEKWGLREAYLKVAATQEFLKSPHSHMLILDSSLICPPYMLKRMLEVDKPIVAEVFWYTVHQYDIILPNVSDQIPYSFSSLTNIYRLINQGVYPVGMFLGCALIERKVFELGVSFTPHPAFPVNWGPDVYFCIRAAVKGIEIVADTCATPFFYNVEYPAVEKDYQEWVGSGMDPSFFRKKYLTEKWKSIVAERFMR